MSVFNNTWKSYLYKLPLLVKIGGLKLNPIAMSKVPNLKVDLFVDIGASLHMFD